jgi:hypothetical protein
MDPLSNVDGLVLVLRQRLLERSRATAPERPGQKLNSGNKKQTSLDNVRALAGIHGVSDQQLGRSLIQSVLADQFGASVINEARFQQVVDRVAETMEAEPGAAGIMAQIVSDLRAAARAG